jgi:hypothetical protein
MLSSQAILGAEGRRRIRKNGAGLSLGKKAAGAISAKRACDHWRELARLRRADRRWPRGRCLVRASIQWERSIWAD